MTNDRPAPAASTPAGTALPRGHARRPIATVIGAALAISINLCAQPAYAAQTPVQQQQTTSSRHVSPVAGVQLSEVMSRTGADTAAFENRLTSDLQKMLDTVVGPGRAVVTTAAELDLDQVDTVSTTYSRDPTAGALSEKLSRKSYTGNNAGTRYESNSAVRSNALNSVRETRRTAPGRVKKLNVAVLVDATAGEAIDLAQLQTLVSVAAGIDPRRGDAVAVAAMPLHTATTENTAAKPDAKPATTWQTVVVTAALGLLILVLLLAARRYTRHEKQMSAKRIHLQQMPAALEHQHTISTIASITPPALDRARHDNVGRQRTINRPASDNPEQSAAVFRAWLDQGATR